MVSVLELTAATEMRAPTDLARVLRSREVHRD